MLSISSTKPQSYYFLWLNLFRCYLDTLIAPNVRLAEREFKDALRTYFLKEKCQQVRLINLEKIDFVESIHKFFYGCLCIPSTNWVCTIFR
jgi:hypothetical protein